MTDSNTDPDADARENVQNEHHGMLNLAIASRVRQLREHEGATIKTLAARSDVPHSNLAQLERGLRQWLPRHIEAVAAALGVQPRDLLPAPGEDLAPRDNPAAPLPLTPGESALVSAVRARDWPAALRALAHLAGE